MTQKLQGTFVANKPTGCIWMCRGCRLKNDLTDTNNNKKKELQFQANNAVSATSESTESTEPAVEDETEYVDDLEDKPSLRRNEPSHNDSRDRVCPLYAKNQCPHGASGKVKVDGETCPNPHPRKCLKFCRYGNKRERGCEKGRSCSHYHPILCKFSVRNGECRKRECTFTHMRHTKRPPL